MKAAQDKMAISAFSINLNTLDDKAQVFWSGQCANAMENYANNNLLKKPAAANEKQSNE